MHARLVVPVLFLAVVVSACRFGGWKEDAVTSPLGGRIVLETEAGTMAGELLLVEEEGILVLGPEDRVYQAPWAALRSLEFRDRPVGSLTRGQEPTPVHRDEMRLASRYPFGLWPEQRAALLEARGQDEPRVLR
jgi:hypothetical protein